MKKEYDLEEMLLTYAVAIIEIVERLPKTKVGTHIGGQLLRSGTSPLSNHGEAQSAESPKDFVHKMRICLKELRESLRWLGLIRRAPSLKLGSEVDPALKETDELIRIFVKSVQTAEGRL